MKRGGVGLVVAGNKEERDKMSRVWDTINTMWIVGWVVGGGLHQRWTINWATNTQIWPTPLQWSLLVVEK